MSLGIRMVLFSQEEYFLATISKEDERCVENLNLTCSRKVSPIETRQDKQLKSSLQAMLEPL